MNRLSALVWLPALLFLLAPRAQAIELDYQWKKGDVHRFTYQDDSKFKMSLGAMGTVEAAIKIKSQFSMKVLSVDAQGTAGVDFTLEKLDMWMNGKKAGSLAQIPPRARVVKAEIDTKGHARFTQMVSVYVHENRVYVGVQKLGPGGVAATGAVGDEEGGVQVDVVAGVDPKTGKITAAVKLKETPPALKKVTLKQEDPAVPAIPKQILEMLVLPEGQLSPGGTIELETPFGTLRARLGELKAGVAPLQLTLTPTEEERGGSTGGGGGYAAEGDEPDPGAMLGGMGGMLGGGGGAAGGMKASAKADLKFDTNTGRLLEMSGTFSLDMNLGGMGGVKTDSAFSLKRP